MGYRILPSIEYDRTECGENCPFLLPISKGSKCILSNEDTERGTKRTERCFFLCAFLEKNEEADED